MEQYLLRMEGISKHFTGTQALKGASIEVRKGECHALLGANGAGKSTIIKILAGIHQADEGAIYIDGRQVRIPDVRASRQLGISVIHQELVLVPHMTIAENIFMGRESLRGFTPFLAKRAMIREAQGLLDIFGLKWEATTLVSSLSVAQQQMVEICRALSMESRLIIMDEPTAALTQKEVEQLYTFIRHLKERNISVMYVSHRLEELFAISDRISIYRDGTYIQTYETGNVDRKTLVNAMVGRSLQEFFMPEVHKGGQPVLEVKNLMVHGLLHDIGFTLRKGEILGFSGLVGSGRTELAQTIFGIRPYEAGTIILNGRDLNIRCPQDAIAAGIGLVPESRKEHGLNLVESVSFNLTLLVLREFIRFCFVKNAKEREIVNAAIKRLDIRTSGPRQKAGQLSGGNQQKVVIAKWLSKQPNVLILDEPTRGVDVGAKAEIYQIMHKLAQNGVSIIMISSELPEVINMSDRILVMHEGRIAGELSRERASQETIMHYATGGTDE